MKHQHFPFEFRLNPSKVDVAPDVAVDQFMTSQIQALLDVVVFTAGGRQVPIDGYVWVKDAFRTTAAPSADSQKVKEPRQSQPSDQFPWRGDIAGALISGNSTQAILDALLRLGVDTETGLSYIRQVEDDPIYRAANNLREIHKKLESVVANQQIVKQLDPNYGVIERVPNAGRDDFLRRYIYGSRPVVLTEVAKDWPALSRWSLLTLRERFGNLPVEVQNSRATDPAYEQNRERYRHTVPFDEFLDRLSVEGRSNDYYLTANNQLLRRPGFRTLFEDIGTLPDICKIADFREQSSLWIGPAGTVTPLHHDSNMFFHTQIVGRKVWRFVSPLQTPCLYNTYEYYSPVDLTNPDYSLHPKGRDLNVLETVVGPGETIFVPLGWWHQVEALDVSVSVSYSNLAVQNKYFFANPTHGHKD